ncbi:MAG: hypothetical protein MK185_11700 [Saccharospirillaceae bacterium]|nr:hypothetical protein [Saccharospirillaceae bacterium]
MTKAAIVRSLAAYIMMTIACVAVIQWQHLWLLLPATLVLNWLYEQKCQTETNFRLIYPTAGSLLTSALLSTQGI